jgi:hypothetical protein
VLHRVLQSATQGATFSKSGTERVANPFIGLMGFVAFFPTIDILLRQCRKLTFANCVGAASHCSRGTTSFRAPATPINAINANLNAKKSNSASPGFVSPATITSMLYSVKKLWNANTTPSNPSPHILTYNVSSPGFAKSPPASDRPLTLREVEPDLLRPHLSEVAKLVSEGPVKYIEAQQY